MNYKDFGKTGMQVSEIGLGCNRLGGGIFSKVDEQAAIRLVHRAQELGVNFFDTSSSYNYGRSETTLGRAMKGRRGQFIIASKTGIRQTTMGRYGKWAMPFAAVVRPLLQPWKKKLKQKSAKQFDFSPGYMQQALEASLRRLQTDYLDLYQLHNPPLEVLKRGEVFETLDKFKAAGKIRFFGASVTTVEEGALALEAGAQGLQIVFNLVEQEVALPLFGHPKIGEAGIIVKTPLMRGLLTPEEKVETGHFNEKYNLLARRMDDFRFLTAGGRTWAGASLQFILSHPQISTVIPGTTSLKHLEENVDYRQHPLTTEDFHKIRELAANQGI